VGDLPLRDKLADLALFVDLDLDISALGDAVGGKARQDGFDTNGIDGEELFGLCDLLY
jgi:hypothetical protein